MRLVPEADHPVSRGVDLDDVEYRGLLEAAPDAMVVVDQDGEIVLLNVQAERMAASSRSRSC